MSSRSAGPRLRHLLVATCGLAGALLASALSARSAPAPSPQDPPDEYAVEWLDAVRTHVPGTSDEPAARIAAWSPKDLDRAFAWFSRSRERASIPLVVRAATLHADIAMWQWSAQQGDTRAPPSPAGGGGKSIAMVIDGRYAGSLQLGGHWPFARRLIEIIGPASADELVRTWYRATVAYLVGGSSYTEAVPHVARAREIFRTDPYFPFASGCVSEAFASPRIQEPARALAADREARVNVAQPSKHLVDAEYAFRDAIKLDPQFAEARLRLGRVLSLRGDRGAVPQLEMALKQTGESTLRYYAYLFVGERREALRQYGEARAAYEEAARLFPQAQTPLLALGHLARRTGNRAEAARMAARFAALGRAGVRRDDPWWTYNADPGRDADRFVAALYAALAKGDR